MKIKIYEFKMKKLYRWHLTGERFKMSLNLIEVDPSTDQQRDETETMTIELNRCDRKMRFRVKYPWAAEVDSR